MGRDLLELDSTVLAWLLTYLVHSTALLGGVWLLLRLRPQTSFRVRDGLWEVGLVGGVVTSLAQLGLGVDPVGGRVVLGDVADADRTAPVIEIEELAGDAAPTVDEAELAPDLEGELARDARPTTAAVERVDSPGRRRRERAEPDRAESFGPRGQATAGEGPAGFPVQHVDAKPVAPVREVPRAVSTDDRDDGEVEGLFASASLPTSPHLGSVSFGAGWSAVWAAGAGLGALALVLALGRLRSHLRRRRPLRSGELVELLEDLRQRSGVTRRVRLSASSRLASPITFGVLFPEICVPERALVELDRGQQEAMLAHELAHAVRRDPLWQLVTRFFVSAFFFQPLNRLARTQLLDTAEYLSDDWAVAHTQSELSLASCLTEIAGWVVDQRRALPAPGMTSGSRLGRRVHRLLDPAASRDRTLARRRGRTLVLTLAALGGVAGIVPGVASPLPDRAPIDAAEPAERIGRIDRIDLAERSFVPAPERVDVPDPLTVPPPSAPLPRSRVDAVRQAIGLLDVQIHALESEFAGLRTAVMDLDESEELLASVERIEHRIARLRVRRMELANGLPKLVRLLELRDELPESRDPLGTEGDQE